jgi:hypothetical protein
MLILHTVACLILAQSASSVRIPKIADDKPPASTKTADEPAPDVSSVRRVYVDKFLGGAGADLLREMLISSLQNSHLFIITEEQDNADAVLKGTAEAETFKDLHISSDSSHIGQRGSRSDSMSVSGHYSTREATSTSNDMSVGDSRSSHIEERKHEASAAVRLVLKNGDVVWSTTQESLGAKFRGASADVAEKVARQLTSDWPKLKRGRLEGE